MINIRIVPYDPQWPRLFDQEASAIAAVFGDALIAIHHIGSTAVPGLAAKPVLDIMPVVQEIAVVDQFVDAMEELGYEFKGENGIPGRRYFQKGGNRNRSHNVHIYEPDHFEVTQHLDFRDYLIAHPEEAQRYAALKAALAIQFPDDIDSYIEGKSAFIRGTIRQARAWRLDRSNQGDS